MTELFKVLLSGDTGVLDAKSLFVAAGTDVVVYAGIHHDRKWLFPFKLDRTTQPVHFGQYFGLFIFLFD